MAMAGVATFALLITWVVMCWAAPGPSEAEVQAACKGHNGVVGYSPMNLWSVDSGPRAVCADGAVKYVK